MVCPHRRQETKTNLLGVFTFLAGFPESKRPLPDALFPREPSALREILALNAELAPEQRFNSDRQRLWRLAAKQSPALSEHLACKAQSQPTAAVPQASERTTSPDADCPISSVAKQSHDPLVTDVTECNIPGKLKLSAAIRMGMFPGKVQICNEEQGKGGSGTLRVPSPPNRLRDQMAPPCNTASTGSAELPDTGVSIKGGEMGKFEK